MPNTSVQATAEGMPSINRRRMLLGLAAASTLAARGTLSEANSAPAENPKLLELIEQMPAIAAAFHEANDKYHTQYREWDEKTPDAPEELTIPGAHPHDVPGQPGEPEMWVLGGYMWRTGEERFPRRIVVKSWDVSWELSGARRLKRQAKKAGNIADFMAVEAEIERLTILLSTARRYEDEFKAVKSQAKAWHSEASPVKEARRETLERHIAEIMNEPDLTMEGLVIKAQALAAWGRVGRGWAERLALKHGQDWQGQIAGAILRHAGGAS